MLIKLRKKLPIFDILNYSVFTILSFITIYPLWYVLVASVEPYHNLINKTLVLIPTQITLAAYETILKSPTIVTAFQISTFSTIVGTICSLCLICIASYVFSVKSFPGKRLCFNIILFTMLFGGGVIPMYMTLKNYGLINNILVYIFPSLLNTFYLIIVKTSFQEIPESLREAGEIDGCSHWRMLWQIYVPLSKPTLATIALFLAVDKWNDLYTGIFYIINSKLYSLQVVIYNMISSIDPSTSGAIVKNGQSLVNEQVRYACIILATLPILLIYPFLQKYFTKGVMLGAIKD